MFSTVNLAQDQSKISRYISNTLLTGIEETLKRGEKVLLYLNKRGSYSSLICTDCQQIWECENCDVSLSVHNSPAKLLCHICGSAHNIPVSCTNCRGTNLLRVGVGTQQIEEVLKKYFETHDTEPPQSGIPSHNTSLNSLLPGEKELHSNVVGNYYETPDYIKKLVKNLRASQTSSEKILSVSALSPGRRELERGVSGGENNIKERIQDRGAYVGGELERTASVPIIYRFDSDSMKTLTSKRESLKNLEDANIIIGTKMLTTGFDFAKIGLIGIILVEQELSYPSFDAEERAYSNLKQLIGRGNRKSQKTEIILQTFIPQNTILQSLTDLSFRDFFMRTLQERKNFHYPPYKEIVELEYRDRDIKKSLTFIQKLTAKLQTYNTDGKYIFLSSSTSFRKNNTHHTKLIIKGENVREFLKNIHKDILKNSKLSVIFHA